MTLKTVKRDRVRMGVVGCGVVAGYGHLPKIAQSDLAELVGVTDPDPRRRQEAADRYGVPGFASFEEMADGVELDAVSLTTHPGVKLELARIAAARGLHAFCEKPLTDTVEQAEELVRLMDEAGLRVGLSFVYRGKQVVQRMMELVREGAIGKLRVVRTVNLWDYHGLRGHPSDAVPGERRRRALRNLGTLDCGVHQLDLLRYLSGGEFDELHAVGALIEPENIYPDHLVVNGRMDNGVLISFEESAIWGYTAKETPRALGGYHLIGDRGVLSYSSRGPHGGSELYVVSGEKQWTEPVDTEKAWEPAYRQFLQMVLGQEVEHRFLADGHDALANMRAANRIIEQCGFRAEPEAEEISHG